MSSKREVRFRVWDESLKTYLHTSTSPSIAESYLSGYELSWRLSGDAWRGDYVIEQWTGLTDLNGVGVYEGDILEEIVPESSKGRDFKARGIVRGGAWSFGIEPVNYGGLMTIEGDRVWQVALDPFKATVIGNVHEHPELLTT